MLWILFLDALGIFAFFCEHQRVLLGLAAGLHNLNWLKGLFAEWLPCPIKSTKGRVFPSHVKAPFTIATFLLRLRCLFTGTPVPNLWFKTDSYTAAFLLSDTNNQVSVLASETFHKKIRASTSRRRHVFHSFRKSLKFKTSFFACMFVGFQCGSCRFLKHGRQSLKMGGHDLRVRPSLKSS
jgi:hypothetical protein